MFQVKLHCPAALPVQFSVSYLVQGHAVTASLPGFPDLGQVPYNSCPTSNTESDSSSELITHASPGRLPIGKRVEFGEVVHVLRAMLIPGTKAALLPR
jgi:hypothetical protein